MTFNDHCIAQGIELLRDDVKFIKRCLAVHERKHHKALLTQYATAWLTGMAEEPSSIKKQGAGRHAANNLLLGVY